MSSLFRPALSIFVFISLTTGLLYPAAIRVIAQTAFAAQAAGSLIGPQGHPVGSSLIGQPFSDAGHFWSRPSATSPNPYNGTASSGSNLAATNPALVDAVKDRIKALRDADPQLTGPIPVDLVTASASGLDPDISPEAAAAQIARVARARNLGVPELEALVSQHTQSRQLGFLGEPRVNVLELNLALEQMRK
jgi:K+-transporting ATPase ATPase C chain